MSHTVNHIFLVRHGKPDFPDEQPRFLGHVDTPLGAEGMAQAERLSLALSEIEFSAAYSSDLQRSMKTAEIILKNRNVALEKQKSLREINPGIFDGHTVKEVMEKYPTVAQERNKDLFHYRLPEGESFSDLERRIIPVFLEIAEHTEGNTLMVCHAGVNRVILRYILQAPEENLFTIQQAYCGVNVIAIHPKKGFLLKAINWQPAASLVIA